MKLLQASFDGVAGVPDIVIDFLDGRVAPGTTLITGPRGSGKTRLLEAIGAGKEAIGPYGTMPRPHDWVRAPGHVAKIRLTWALDEQEQRATGASGDPIVSEAILGSRPIEAPDPDAALVHVLEAYDHHSSVAKMEYFPARRRLPPSTYAYVGRPPSVDAKRRTRLTASDEKYDSVRQYLLELCLGLHERDPEGEGGADRFAAAFARLCTSKRFDGLSNGSHGQRLVFSDALGNTYDLDHLSASEKDAALIAATFIEVGLERSIVLIDTPELWVGESEVVAFMSGIAAIGALNQLIVATASPSLIASVAPKQVVRLR